MTIVAIKEVSTRVANAETKTLRQTLSDMLRIRDAAKHARDEAVQALTRADEFIEGLRVAAEHSEATISADVTARAGEIKEALKSGFTVPRLPSTSSEAARAQLLKAQAVTALASAEEARTALAADLETAEAAFAKAASDAHQAAAAVVASVADKEALELLALERKAAGLRRRLQGVGRIRPPHLPRFPIDGTTHAILRGDTTPHYAHETEVDVAVWIDLERLLLDGDIDAQPERGAA
jgi:hypothetical protein